MPLLLQDATSRKVGLSQAAVAGLRLMAVTVTSQALLSPYHTFTEFEKKDRSLSGLATQTLAPTPYDAV